MFFAPRNNFRGVHAKFDIHVLPHGFHRIQYKTVAGRRAMSLTMITVKRSARIIVETLETRMAHSVGAQPENAFLFDDNEGAPQKPDMISVRWRNAVPYRALPALMFLALRHSHASAMFAAGKDFVSVSKRPSAIWAPIRALQKFN
jgi:hypothetical protein